MLATKFGALMLLGNVAHQFWVTGAIILVSGVFGGWTALLTGQAQDRAQADQPNLTQVSKYIALGLSAAFCVPLFLSLVQSSLISKIFNPEKTDCATVPYSEFLIFAGIRMIESISARNFIDTLSDKVLRDVSRLERKTDRIDQTATTAGVKATRAEENAQNAPAVALDLLDEQASEQRQATDALAPQLLSDTSRRPICHRTQSFKCFNESHVPYRNWH